MAVYNIYRPSENGFVAKKILLKIKDPLYAKAVVGRSVVYSHVQEAVFSKNTRTA
jgi:hypothetical protein